MPAEVDALIEKIAKKVGSKSKAIRIAKANGWIVQKGSHLAPGPKMPKKK